MLELGLIGFAQPWLLAGLLILPGLWWLLRLTPPPPRQVRFPAIALLIGLAAKEESAARMPWWLLLLRLVLAALVILALAEPVLAPQHMVRGNGPLLIVVDNGWAPGSDWEKRRTALNNLLEEAGRTDRAVAVLTTAARLETAPPVSFRPAAAWRAEVGAMAPQPWETDRAGLFQSLDELSGPMEAFWLTDGLASPADEELTRRLQRLGGLTVYADGRAPLLLAEPEAEATGFGLRARRPASPGPQTVTVEALAEDGRVVGNQPLAFEPGETEASADWTLPRDLANQVRQLRIAGRSGAGGVVLLDDRWLQRSVGLVEGGSEQSGHLLLDASHYIGSALAEVAQMEQGSLADLLEAAPSLMMTRGRLTPETAQAEALNGWLRAGGVLVRFAGPEIAATPDDWLPVRVRPASRVLGGALSWDEPQPLAAFPEASPFAGLPVPDDVLVRSQVLAVPAADLREKTWASLTDGTPLVTAEQRGEGWIVLIHVTANADWSDLPLSGLFVEMLERLVRLGSGKAVNLPVDAALPARQVIDGFGKLQEPPPGVQALPARAEARLLGPQHPPGYYGDESNLRAFNLGAAIETLEPQSAWPDGVEQRAFGGAESKDIASWLWLAAFVLLLADFAASLWLRGHAPWRRAAAAVIALCLFALPLTADPAAANDHEAWRASLDTRLAYVKTGDPDLDRVSAAGLSGLSWVLSDRTSIEPGQPVGVDIERSELAFFPLLYWPVSAGQRLPSDLGRERIARYLEQGGTILFDTRDQYRTGGSASGSSTPERQRLRQLLDGVRVPPLTQVPADHVLTRSFYLLQEFPGRYTGGAVWVEANADTARDGVTSVIIGGHDWAAAWALDQSGRPQFPVMPGGPRQREFAYRFGVNLVMHVLTGNYKGDQVHVPSILNRLSQ
jgi:hypothetical protein